jgi:hypothetical protein
LKHQRDSEGDGEEEMEKRKLKRANTDISTAQR